MKGNSESMDASGSKVLEAGQEKTRIKGAEAVLKCLLEEDVDTIFGYPGGAIMPVYDALFYYETCSKILFETYLHSLREIVMVIFRIDPDSSNIPPVPPLNL